MSRQLKRTVGDYVEERPKRPPKKTKRNHPAYNKAAERKWRHFPPLLAHLCAIAGQPAQTGRGRPVAPPADILFACVLKVARKISARDLQSELELAYEHGLISSMPRWPTVLKYLRDPELSEFFRAL